MINYNMLATAIRMLSADAVENAKSGHPGMPMGMAEIATVLWKNYLKHNPDNPKWFDRDRFILSNGHGSMLIYSLLHLTGYSLNIEDIKQFRQLGSKTPGHPEYGYTDGVETTTGPLGQGIANSVGMALAEKLLAQEFNQDGFNVVDHYTYTFIGDGCLMEGISHEVCSFAGTLKLGKLIVFYDDNGISIDGEVKDWFNENVASRFNAYNWQVIDNVDGHNLDQINAAIIEARANTDQPTLIICKTTIGKGSPNKAGKEESHGSPLGASELELTRRELSWNYAPFQIPQEVYSQFSCKESGNLAEAKWNESFTRYKDKHPKLATELERRLTHTLPDNWGNVIYQAAMHANDKKETIATRKASQNAIEFFAEYLPEFLGGSADLTGSNLTKWTKAIALDEKNNFTGNYISYGVREFGMSAMLNGIFLHGGYRPFGGTFLMFSEYARNALRMASLMKIAPIFVYTHDSIGLGEDGPTHQPVEQLATLRMIPNMHIWRPCDTVETNVAWGLAISHTNTPSCLIFSRQNLKFIDRDSDTIKNIQRGGYILRKNADNAEVLIVATGSEVELALSVYENLCNIGKTVQLVSMPSTSTFDQQNKNYKKQVLLDSKYKIAIEAGVSDTWYKYIGNNALIIGIDTFGESAKINDLFNHFGFTSEQVINRIKDYIKI